MVSQVILSAEALAAYVTWVRSFVRVCTLMDQEVVRLGEVSTAELTDVLLAGPTKKVPPIREYRALKNFLLRLLYRVVCSV